MARRDSESMAKTKVDWLSKLDSNTMNGLLSRRASFSFSLSPSHQSSLLLFPIHPGDSSSRTRFRTREIFRRGIEQRTLIGKGYSFVGNRFFSEKKRRRRKYANSFSVKNSCFARFEDRESLIARLRGRV